MSGEHRGPAPKALDEMILKKMCPLLMALFVCLSVTKAGKVSEDPKHVNATLGEDVVLFCGFEFPENKSEPYGIEWQKQGIKQPIYVRHDGHPPILGKGYKGRLSLAHQASLNLIKVRKTDQGLYECRVFFLHRATVSPKNVTWVYLDVRGPASIVLPPQNITELEGERAVFLCKANRTVPSNITHRWFHNGVEISKLPWLENRTFVRKGDGALIINPISAEDSGKFTCEVTNGIGIPDTASAFLSLGYPARVTFSPPILYLPLGKSGMISCYFQANPPFLFVLWAKDHWQAVGSSNLRPINPYSIPGMVTLSNGSLLIERVTYSVQGRYRCTPYNVYGSAGTSGVMNVKVIVPPMYTIIPEEIYQISVDNEITLPCEGIAACYEPVVTWRRADGSELPTERVFIQGGNLTIRGLKKEDYGRYECVLENVAATLVRSTLLLVESTTHAPTNVTVNTSSVDATLNWLPAYDGGQMLSYDIRYRVADQDDSDWQTVVNSYAAITFTVSNLQADTEYDFQVLSRNELGNELFSPIVTAKTKTAYNVGVSTDIVSPSPPSTRSRYRKTILETLKLVINLRNCSGPLMVLDHCK